MTTGHLWQWFKGAWWYIYMSMTFFFSVFHQLRQHHDTTFQQDKVHPHLTCIYRMNCLHRIDGLLWSTRSPDLKQINHVRNCCRYQHKLCFSDEFSKASYNSRGLTCSIQRSAPNLGQQNSFNLIFQNYWHFYYLFLFNYLFVSEWIWSSGLLFS